MAMIGELGGAACCVFIVEGFLARVDQVTGAGSAGFRGFCNGKLTSLNSLSSSSSPEKPDNESGSKVFLPKVSSFQNPLPLDFFDLWTMVIVT